MRNNLVNWGDLNTAHKEMDIARPKENSNVSGFLPIEREWIDKFLANGYTDTFRMFNDQPSNIPGGAKEQKQEIEMLVGD